jgi:uncharacterized protein YqeY
METIQQIEDDLIQAQKRKKEAEVLALRGIKSAIKNAEIAKRPEQLTEADVLKVLRSEVKRRQDAIDLYQRGERQDLVDKESKEIQVIEKYLPKELTDNELKAIVQKVVASLKASGLGDFGKVMGAVMKEVAGRTDGSKVSEIVREILSEQ